MDVSCIFLQVKIFSIASHGTEKGMLMKSLNGHQWYPGLLPAFTACVVVTKWVQSRVYPIQVHSRSLECSTDTLHSSYFPGLVLWDYSQDFFFAGALLCPVCV